MKKAIKLLILKNRLSGLKSSRKKSIKYVSEVYSDEIEESAEEILPDFFEEIDNEIEATSRLIDIIQSK
jgi:hypothetical protein